MNQTRNIVRAIGASLVAGVGAAQAAVPAEVSTALGTMKDDALIVAGLVLVAIIAVAAFKFMKKAF